MPFLGVNLGTTTNGRALRDGGACIIREDGEVVVAIAEERISRQKYAGGSRLSVAYCLAEAGLTRRDIDLVVATSCCEEVPDADNARRELGSFGSIQTAGHHLAHAYSAFWASEYNEALVLVMDAGGIY